ncbi:MAG: DUF2284 domain-containing protein [Deltaproteobacteria bacterium]|nr:DUF2284 domain-containing protein [Deltaproteobacteria bacterium]
MTFFDYARELDITTCIEFDPILLVPEERIRAYCRADKCRNYGKNYMCPPHIGTLENISARLNTYDRGFLLQYERKLDVKNDRSGSLKTQDDFHRKILELEAFLREQGVAESWGLIGGNCRLCQPCKAVSGEPCAQPGRARPSLESLAIDVQRFLAGFGLDLKFREDRITWTGAVLYRNLFG